MLSSYHEQLHHDILFDVAWSMLVVVGYHTVVVVIVSVLQAKYKH